MSEFQPSRQQSDLADVIELLLDKGVVINADIAVSIGDTQLLGIQIRAAIASFDTAARYGLEFPEGTDMRRMAEAVGDPEIAEMDRPKPPVNPVSGVNVTSDEEVASNDGADEEGDADSDGESSDAADDGDDGNAAASDDDGNAAANDDDGNAADDDGGSGLMEDDDRGSERLGARPDPDTPGEGDLDLMSDGGDEGEETDDDRSAEAENR